MIQNGAHKYRGLTRAKVSPADEARFWRLVEKTKGCWYWRTVDRGTYGTFRLRDAGITSQAHKISVVISGRDIPEGMVVMHACDERSCVNPAHLSVGTQSENVRDCITKGRHKKQAA